MYTGKEITLPVERLIECVDCEGKGGSKVTMCGTCRGMGAVIGVQNSMFGSSHVQMECPHCRGEGRSVAAKDKCRPVSPHEASSNIIIQSK